MWPVDGAKLKQFRQDAHLTQVELANKANVPQPTISDIERGKVERTGENNVRALAAVLGRKPQELLQRFEEPKPAEPTEDVDALIEQMADQLQRLRQAVRIPVLSGSAHAHWVEGFPLDLELLQIERYVSGGPEFHGRAVWGVPVRGSCLEPDVRDGDLAIFERGVPIHGGNLVVAIHMGALIVKRATVVEGAVRWLDDNDTEAEGGEPIRVNGHTHVLGRVVQTRRDW